VAAPVLIVTYGAVTCGNVNAASISAACTSLTAKTEAEFAHLKVTSCTGYCATFNGVQVPDRRRSTHTAGGMVLKLTVDKDVPAAVIDTVKQTIISEPASVQITVSLISGATLSIDATDAHVEIATTAAPTTVADTGAGPEMRNGNTNTASGGATNTHNHAGKIKKGKKDDKAGRTATAADGKGKKDKKGKKGKKGDGQASQLTGTDSKTAATAVKTGACVLLGMIGVVGVALGLRRRRAAAADGYTFPGESTEKSPLMHAPATPGDLVLGPASGDPAAPQDQSMP